MDGLECTIDGRGKFVWFPFIQEMFLNILFLNSFSRAHTQNGFQYVHTSAWFSSLWQLRQ